MGLRDVSQRDGLLGDRLYFRKRPKYLNSPWATKFSNGLDALILSFLAQKPSTIPHISPKKHPLHNIKDLLTLNHKGGQKQHPRTQDHLTWLQPRLTYLN